MTAERNKALASRARRVYLEGLVRGLASLGMAVGEAAQQLLALPAEYPVMVARRDGVNTWSRHGPSWQAALINALAACGRSRHRAGAAGAADGR